MLGLIEMALHLGVQPDAYPGRGVPGVQFPRGFKVAQRLVVVGVALGQADSAFDPFPGIKVKKVVRIR